MQTVLAIAGFDPSSGAGVTADLMVFAAHGLFGTSCITSLTVQSTLGVRSTHPVPPSVLSETLECLEADLPPSGIKIGMLGSKDNINRIIEYLNIVKRTHECLIVLDPVLRSSSGRELVDPSAVALIRDRLLPLVDWITPNLDELAVLAEWPAIAREDVPAASQALQARVTGRSNSSVVGVLATGGHLDAPDDFLLLPNGEQTWLPGERVLTRSTHGTGCALSSAFLSRLLLGDPAIEAAKAAKNYVAGALKTARGYGSGNGPLNHLWNITDPTR
jgi:hydroxymethylpyrimidine/phosphomethylpyrimidine kinase